MPSKRPSFHRIKTGTEFRTWYWLKSELEEIAVSLGIPKSGKKEVLLDRIEYFMDNNRLPPEQPTRTSSVSRFNWAREPLSLDTRITDTVSFGPNFRSFMKQHIGKRFSCHSDFMDWVKSNTGKTLFDAVEAWEQLEARKKDPSFRRKIASYNMYNQYVRDFIDHHPAATIREARTCWLKKKEFPMKDGFVRYENGDYALIHDLVTPHRTRP